MSAAHLHSQPVMEPPINYLADRTEKPYSYTFTPPAGIAHTNRRVVAVKRPIYDARKIAASLSLERQGLELVHQTSAVQDFYNEEGVKRVYYPALTILSAAM
jgi:hypothetical protein